ncbi:MAG TPA: enoyl-CoA hydratase/isomerase family protein [Methylomirabilota bacterium]|jgi:enoyl-CoA hydratase/carnithine racemase|nr:enoyl-CoA hydratase/isomerase family protein [Methylomirabilota bacterium]
MIRLHVDGPAARITFDRPEVLNAGDVAFVRELTRTVAALQARPELRVVVLTGAGRAFSTGVDLTALAWRDLGLPDFIAWEDAMTAMERMDKLLIAGINGHCLGGGLQLALVCDYRLAAEDALIGLPAVKECLIPSMATYRLPRLIGMARAKELILEGAPISSRQALEWGLVNRVVSGDEFARALDETVERYLALPASSALASKRLTTSAFDLDFDTFRKAMTDALRAAMESPEHARAMADIRARKPR